MDIGDYNFVNLEVTDLMPEDVAYLDKMLLDENGRLKVLPADEYIGIPPLHLKAWASLHSRYGFPTVELIAWLKERIVGRSALEIAAGNGDLGYRLGIPMTDSYQQIEDPETIFYLASLGIAATNPPPDVEKEDGESAVRRRKPQVVIACYATEKWDKRNPARGNYKGVRYDYIIERCATFILIGNESTHGQNRALSLPHEKFYFPWLVSRSKDQYLNRIWVWQGGKK